MTRRVIPIFILISFVAAGCGGDVADFKLRHDIIGTWNIPPAGTMTLFPDDTYHYTNCIISNGVSMSWSSDGAWFIEEGLFVTAVTNSLAWNNTNKPAVGDEIHYSVKVDAHTLVIDDGKGLSSTYHR